MGTAMTFLDDLAARTLPAAYSVDYGGQFRQLKQESGGFLVTFGFALIIIFLELAALFESFRDPFIILVSVPMSIPARCSSWRSASKAPASTSIPKVGLVTLMA